MSYLGYYLIAMNIIGFILFAINTWLYSHTPDRQIDKLLTVNAKIKMYKNYQIKMYS